MADLKAVVDDVGAAADTLRQREPAAQPPARGRAGPLPRRLQALFAGALAVAALAGIALVGNLVNLRESTQQLDHFRAVQEALERMQSALVDAETGQRGYLLTGRTPYLEPYLNAKQAYPLTLAFLEGAVDGDVNLQRGLAELKPMITEKLAIIDRTIARYQTRGDIVPSNAGRETMDRIREIIAGMRSHVAARIAATNQASHRNAVLTFIVAILAVLLGIVTLAIVRHEVGVEQQRRNAAEDQLRDRSALLSAVTEGTEDWVFVKDRQGRLLFANGAVARAFDSDPEQLLGKLPADYVFDENEASVIHANDLRIMASGTSERVEQVITSQGEKRTYFSTKTPRFDSSGHVIGLIGIGTDITERKTAEQVLATVNQSLTAAVAEQTAQLTELSQHLIRVAEEERRLLAAELHDELGALHTVITMDLAAIDKEVCGDSPELSMRLRHVLTLVDQARQVKRRIIADLRPILLDDFGVIAALTHYVEGWSRSSQIKVTISHDDAFPALSPGLALALFRVVQESLTNVAKYSGARSVSIRFAQERDEVSVTVTDDGVGITPAELELPRSHGISGMRQRVANFGGRFRVGRGADGTGTVVVARVPIQDDVKRPV